MTAEWVVLILGVLLIVAATFVALVGYALHVKNGGGRDE